MPQSRSDPIGQEAWILWLSLYGVYQHDPFHPALANVAKDFLKRLPRVSFYKPDFESVTPQKVREAMELGVPKNPGPDATFETFWSFLEVFLAGSEAPELGSAPEDGEGAEDDEDAAAVSSAFDLTRYLNLNAVRLLLAHLWLYACHWFGKLSAFYAPYSALINASMTGKSRLVTELHKHGVFLLMICLRPDEDPNYRPPRTPLLADWATRREDIVSDQVYTQEACAFFYGFLFELHAFLKSQKEGSGAPKTFAIQELTEAWYKEVYVKRDSEIWSRVFNQHISRISTAQKKGKKNSIASLDKIIGEWRGRIIKRLAELDEVLIDLLGETAWMAEKKKQVNFLFVVDETRQLNVASKSKDRFAVFRRAMRCLPFNDKETRGNLFCLVTDTTSKVANLAPVQKYDPSFRIAKHEGMRLFPPCTLMDTIDVWWDAALVVRIVLRREGRTSAVVAAVKDVLNQLRSQLGVPTHSKSPQVVSDGEKGFPMSTLGEGGLSRELLESFELMATFGRPAYYGFLCFRGPAETEVGFNSLLTLLQGKLLCQKPTAVEPEEEIDEELQAEFNGSAPVRYTAPLPWGFSTAQVMGVLGAIASVHISAASHLASELASGHMRLVSAISKQRNPLPDHVRDTLPWSVIIGKYTATVLNNTTSIGFRGEIALQILCLMAWQKCIMMTAASRSASAGLQLRLPEFRFPFVPALVFIKKLVGEAFFNQLPDEVRVGLERDLANAYVRVNQFVKTFAELGVDTLREYFLRASGVYCQEGQKAVDLALGLWFGPDFTEKSFSALLLQVKLQSRILSEYDLQSWFKAVDSLPLLDKIPTHLPTVAICIEVGPGRGAEATVPNFNTRAPQRPTTRIDGFIRPQIPHEESHGGRPAKFAYALRFRSVSVENVDEDAHDAIEAFNRLLESTIDPSESLNVEFIHRQQIKEVFKTQPYMNTRSTSQATDQ